MPGKANIALVHIEGTPAEIAIKRDFLTSVERLQSEGQWWREQEETLALASSVRGGSSVEALAGADEQDTETSAESCLADYIAPNRGGSESCEDLMSEPRGGALACARVRARACVCWRYIGEVRS